MSKITPYNNGKLKIGSRYVPRAERYSSNEDAFIHDLMFPHTADRSAKRARTITSVVIAIVIITYIGAVILRSYYA